MRYRQRPGKASFDTVYTRWYRDGGLAISNDVSYMRTSEVSSMLDINIENFYQKRAKGELIFNPMSQYVEKSESEALTFSISSRLGERVDQGTLATKPFLDLVLPSAYTELQHVYAIESTFSSTEFDSFRDAAVTQAFAKCADSSVMLYATIGEGRETFQLIIENLKRISRLISTTKHRYEYRYKDIKKDIMSLPDLWMEIRYGVRPLLYEIKQYAALFDAQVNEKFRMTHRAFRTALIDVSVENVQHAYDYVTYVNSIKKIEKLYSIRAGVMFGPIGRSMPLVSILGLDRPIASIWELVKFSFLIDWFVNVGDYISSFELNSSTGILGTFAKETVEIKTTIVPGSLVVDWAPFGYVVDAASYIGGKAELSQKVVRRFSPTVPLLPSIDINLDWAKLTDIAIILKQLLL